MIGLVAVAHRIPDARLRLFLAVNEYAIRAHAARVWIVTAEPVADMPAFATALPYPVDLPIFSLAKTSNFGLRAAIDAGCSTVAKTDIDCLLSRALLDRISETVGPGQGACPIYWLARSAAPADLLAAKPWARSVGTVALTADDWLRVKGYNERCEGYGAEDGELRDRARRLGIRMPRPLEPRLYHLAHDPGSPQVPGGRNDLWNADTANPMNRSHNSAQRSSGWDSDEWGRP